MSAESASSEGAPEDTESSVDAPDWSPFPGLRPFQPDDSEYFYGRDVEVDEVTSRLRERRFVAIIGGSGSGKSSLVLAGAIPRLRSFAIKSAGDFWAPVVATPGTNHIAGDGPVRRLARKFCAELIDSDDAPARLEACVAILRRRNGLGELVNRFGAQLKGTLSVSLDSVQVNYLFLLDQFEELFHPSNAREPIVGECRELVNRIVEQFKQPHPQVCVALTMRSEYLNDCPRYDELPDAINGASYLVKRLGREQLRSAIEQPVLRYLRKHVAEQRVARRRARVEGGAALPAAPSAEEVSIDPLVIERLLADSIAVMGEQDHADHLPLLQHLLFWVWHEAKARCEGQAQIGSLTFDDLWAAVGALPGTGVAPLAPSVNTLKACLENRCEAIFARDLGVQPIWEAAFRSLAFKEPNTGTYTQQRASMAELRQRLGLSGDDDEMLGRHLQPWRKPHGYLHWDLDSHTVKVAHETLIRRWERFRHWVDEEDRQFHVYLRLVEDCERWDRAKRTDWALSGGDTLRRYEDEKLPAVLRDPVRVARIERLLGMDRDGQRLSMAASDASRFLDLSIENRRSHELRREREEEQRREGAEQLARAKRDNDVAQAELAAASAGAIATSERMRRVKISRWGAVGMLLLVAGYTWTELRLATKERTLHRSYALAAETQVAAGDIRGQFPGFDSAQPPLLDTLTGTYLFHLGVRKPTGPAAWAGPSLVYQPRTDGLKRTELLGEVRNIASLRTVLQGSPWRLAGDGGGSPVPAMAAVACASVGAGAAGNRGEFQNARFFPRGEGDARGLMVTDAGGGGFSIYAARLEKPARACVVESLLISTPQEPTQIGLASDLSNFVFGFPGYQQFYAVLWADLHGVQQRLRSVVNRAAPVAVTAGVSPLPSARSQFATDVVLDGNTIRLFDLEPSPIGSVDAQAGQPMTLVKPDDAVDAANTPREIRICKAFARARRASIGDSIWVAPMASGASVAHCLQVKHAIGANGAAAPFLASLYGFGDEKVAADTEKHVPLFRDLVLGARQPTDYRINSDNGWLAFKGEDESWRAVPWSVDAWGRLASPLILAAKAPVTKPEGVTPGQGAVPAAADPRQASASEPSTRRLILGEELDTVDIVNSLPGKIVLPVKAAAAAR